MLNVNVNAEHTVTDLDQVCHFNMLHLSQILIKDGLCHIHVCHFSMLHLSQILIMGVLCHMHVALNIG